MVRTLIVDDEPLARRRLSVLLEELGASIAGTAGTAAEAFRLVDRTPVDAAFLDIRLPEIDGLALGDRLRRSGVAVVFVTGFPEYALPAFDLGAADYLLKPVSRDRLGRALSRVLGGDSVHERGGVDRLCLRDGEDRTVLPVRALLYARREGGITTIVLDQEAMRVPTPLDRLERALAPHGFFRSHRAYLVNLRRVRRIVPWSRDAQSLLLDDPKETLVPLAKSRVQALRSHLIWP